MSHYTRGIVISTTAIIAGLVSFYTAWDVWLSKATIDNGQTAAILNTKIDVLLQRNGVDPLIFSK